MSKTGSVFDPAERAERIDVSLPQRLAAFFERLPEMATQDELAENVAAVSRPFGLPTVMAGAVYLSGSYVRARFYFGNWPSEWMARYTASVLSSDPLVGEARRRMASFTWSELKEAGGLSPDMIAAFEAGTEAGWSDGLAVPIHGPAGYVALVSFAGSELRLGAPDRAMLRAVAHAAHDRSREIARPPSTTALLTRRETEVMRWVACGKSDWQIGRILGIAESTAHFHVERAKRKLGVQARREAVAALVVDGHL